jgi:hypothetical protein
MLLESFKKSLFAASSIFKLNKARDLFLYTTSHLILPLAYRSTSKYSEDHSRMAELGVVSCSTSEHANDNANPYFLPY